MILERHRADTILPMLSPANHAAPLVGRQRLVGLGQANGPHVIAPLDRRAQLEQSNVGVNCFGRKVRMRNRSRNADALLVRLVIAQVVLAQDGEHSWPYAVRGGQHPRARDERAAAVRVLAIVDVDQHHLLSIMRYKIGRAHV